MILLLCSLCSTGGIAGDLHISLPNDWVFKFFVHRSQCAWFLPFESNLKFSIGLFCINGGPNWVHEF